MAAHAKTGRSGVSLPPWERRESGRYLRTARPMISAGPGVRRSLTLQRSIAPWLECSMRDSKTPSSQRARAQEPGRLHRRRGRRTHHNRWRRGHRANYDGRRRHVYDPRRRRRRRGRRAVIGGAGDERQRQQHKQGEEQGLSHVRLLTGVRSDGRTVPQYRPARPTGKSGWKQPKRE